MAEMVSVAYSSKITVSSKLQGKVAEKELRTVLDALKNKKAEIKWGCGRSSHPPPKEYRVRVGIVVTSPDLFQGAYVPNHENLAQMAAYQILANHGRSQVAQKTGRMGVEAYQKGSVTDTNRGFYVKIEEV